MSKGSQISGGSSYSPPQSTVRRETKYQVYIQNMMNKSKVTPDPNAPASSQVGSNSSPGSKSPPGEKIGPHSFICNYILGKGSFGEVFLVERPPYPKKYAMKVLKKEKILGQNLTRYAKTERNVLSLMNHPFIVRLNYAFQTDTRLYLILDYCPG
jgi:hypothetical protein